MVREGMAAGWWQMVTVKVNMNRDYEYETVDRNLICL